MKFADSPTKERITGPRFSARWDLKKVFAEAYKIISQNGTPRFEIQVNDDGDLKPIEITVSNLGKVKLGVVFNKNQEGKILASLVDESNDVYKGYSQLDVAKLSTVLKQLNAISLLSVLQTKPAAKSLEYKEVLPIQTREIPAIGFIKFNKPKAYFHHDNCLFKYYLKDPTFKELTSFCLKRLSELEAASKFEDDDKRSLAHNIAVRTFSTKRMTLIVSRISGNEKLHQTFINYLLERLQPLAIPPEGHTGEWNIKKFDWAVVLLAFLRDFKLFFRT